MSDIRLILPDAKYKNQCEQYKEVMLENNSRMDGCGRLRGLSVDEWLKECEAHQKGKGLPEGYVPATQFIGVRKSDNKVVGMLQLRHKLNDYLLKIGGHIGYSVAVDERRKGYAKELLKQALLFCKKMGINPVLVTCKKENEASAKTILANGGILENEVENITEDGTDIMQRYWIKIK